MIKSVTIHRLDIQTRDDLKLILTSPEESQGFAVLSIDGLGPGHATSSSTEWSTIDGAHHDYIHVPKRDIIINLALTDLNVHRYDNIEDVRVRSYKYFPRKKNVRLTFEMDSGLFWIDGIVVGNEPDIWQKQETQKISIECPDPYFKAYDADVYKLSNIVDCFKFPFAIEEYPGVPISEIVNLDTVTAINRSDVEVGGIFTITSLGETTGFIMYNETNNQYFSLDYTMSRGEEITIDTRKGYKSIKKSDGTDLMNAYVLGSKWIEFMPGENNIGFGATSGFSNLRISFSVRSIYDGI